jgi:esterase/lipase superfamily enzyme
MVYHAEVSPTPSSAANSGLQFGQTEVVVYRPNAQFATWNQNQTWISPREMKFAIGKTKSASWEETFARFLKETNSDGTNTKVVVVHGCCEDRDSALQHAATFGFNLKLGTVGLFRWPANGSKGLYVQDLDRARSAASHFRAFFSRLLQVGNSERIVIVAHSLGTRIVLEALAGMPANSRTGKAQQLVLIAGDAEHSELAGASEGVRSHFSRLSIYRNERDLALKVSSGMRGVNRIGIQLSRIEGGQRFGFECVDVTEMVVPSMDIRRSFMEDIFGHTYHLAEPRVITDLFESIRLNSKRPVTTALTA